MSAYLKKRRLLRCAGFDCTTKIEWQCETCKRWFCGECFSAHRHDA